MVISKKRPKAFLSLLMALLIVGTANHCIFEDFFASFSKIVFGTEVPEHLPNHLGHKTPPAHNDSPQPHEHGQPHSVIAFRFEKASSDFLTLLLAISSLCFVAIYSFGFAVVGRKTEVILPFTTGDPPGFIGTFISSLTLAPQAPPI